MISILDPSSGKCGVVDGSGKVIIPFEYDDIKSGTDFFTVCKGGHWGVLNSHGNIVIKPKHENLGEVDKDGILPFQKNGQWGLMSLEEEVVMAPTYARLDEEINGLYLGYNYRNHTLFNVEGSIKKTFSTTWLSYQGCYSRIGYYAEEFEKYGYTSLMDCSEIFPIYDDVQHFSNGVAPVEIGEHRTFIDWNGTPLLTERCEKLCPFSEDIAAFKRDDQWGFLCAPHEVIVQPRFKSVGSFAHGLCAVQSEDGYGYINPLGTMVINCQFEYAWPFNQFGLAKVEKRGSVSVINKRGQTVWSLD